MALIINASKLRQRVCTFCRVPLTKKNQSHEHILRLKWLKELNHLDTPIRTAFWSKQVILGHREPPGRSFVAGDICKTCNNGWMNQLDEDVDVTLMRHAKELGDVDLVFTDDEAFKIGRWLIKTACAFQAIDSTSRRHIPVDILTRIHEPDYFPPGYAVFAVKVQKKWKKIVPVIFDVWSGHSHILFDLPQSERLKFGVQYDQIIFICCYARMDEPNYTLSSELIKPVFFPNGALWAYHWDPLPLERWVELGMSEQRFNHIMASPLHFFLWHIDVTVWGAMMAM